VSTMRTELLLRKDCSRGGGPLGLTYSHR
jgi:hypothetical protein